MVTLLMVRTAGNPQALLQPWASLTVAGSASCCLGEGSQGLGAMSCSSSLL